MPPSKSSHARLKEIQQPSTQLSSSDLPRTPSSPRFGLEAWESKIDVDALKRHFRAILAADHAVSHHIQNEVDGLEELVRCTSDACKQIMPQTRREQEECEHLTHLRLQLNRQLLDAKHQLAGLLEECHVLGRKFRSRQHDCEHFREQFNFLRQMIEDEQRMLAENHHANIQLKESCKTLTGDLADLARERKEVSEQALREKDILFEEEEQNVKLRGELEQLRQGLGIVGPKTTVLGPGRHVQKSPLSPGSSKHSEPFSWASSLVGDPVGHKAAVVGGIRTPSVASDVTRSHNV